MMYLGGDKGWTPRPAEFPNAWSTCGLNAGVKRKPNAKRINNRFSGDARPSTVALGKLAFDMRVDIAVKQIREFQSAAAAPPATQK